jgi:hypothetical protein
MQHVDHDETAYEKVARMNLQADPENLTITRILVTDIELDREHVIIQFSDQSVVCMRMDQWNRMTKDAREMEAPFPYDSPALKRGLVGVGKAKRSEGTDPEANLMGA